MRTYLTTLAPAGPVSAHPELAMTCNCGVTKRLAEFVPAGVRPKSIGSINLLRLMEWAGNFAAEHASCPNEAPKKADDLSDIPFASCDIGHEPSPIARVLRGVGP